MSSKIEFVMSVLLMGVASVAASQAILLRLKSSAQLKGMGITDRIGISSPLIGLFLSLGAPIRPVFVKYPRFCNSRWITKLISAAGFAGIIDAPGIFAGLTSAASVGCAIVLLTSERPTIAFIILGALAGPVCLIASINARARARREKIDLALPYALDWMSLSVEAGLDFIEALGRITRRMRPGPLREEFMKVESSIRIGMTRREALSQMAKRASVPALSSFAAMLIQADALGTSIGPVLKAQAQKLRSGRFSRAERKGVAAQQKALIPIALCIMPATFLIIFGPIVARLVTGGIDSLFR